MDYLLDTCTLLWLLLDDKHITKEIKDIVRNKDNIIFISPISLWEIQIKHLKKPELMPYAASNIYNIVTQTKIKVLPFQIEHLISLKDIYIQNVHNDPFDQMLLSISITDNLILISHDKALNKYLNTSILNY